MKFKNRLIFCIVLMLLAAGCAASADSTKAEQSIQSPTPSLVPATQTRSFSVGIAAGESNGSWYELADALGRQMTDSLPNVRATAQATDTVMENLKLLTSGKAGLAFGYDYHVILANQGTLAGAFPKAEPEKLTIKCGVEITRPSFPEYAQAARIIMALHEEHLLIVTTEATGISTLIDLKGRRLSSGLANSGTEEQAVYVLKALGLDWDTDFKHEQMGLADSIAALKNGSIDAFFWSGEASTALIDLESVPDLKIKLLSIDGEIAEKILQAYPQVFHKSRLTGSSFGLDTDVDTLAVTVVLTAMQEFPNDLTRQIISMIIDGRLDPGGLTAELSLAQLKPEARAYLHEGSIEYFKEQGLSK
ncbi:TAXI family TRAP transporter solute-binding subunit [Candidatus Villigracilis saccharophilus]|uniref:TAXI family TRAP transporter solute-binding subunit n=1 Tax=Candidatus Villigracilis saccharophilus TaxID=3140684 RepID=UPI0031373FD8|nr:TAXI family TRAP transporter solute-binding subunit [Anaerolineales bacterium]